MTKVEIDGKTYCVETLIYEVERLTKDVKASAEYHRLVLDKIKADIEKLITFNIDGDYISEAGQGMQDCLEIIDKYKAESEEI